MNTSLKKMPKVPSFVVEESLNSVKVFWLKQEELVEGIRSLACKLGEKDENILQIILFGSLAEGKAVPGSDADILIILKQDKKPFLERIPAWHQKFSLNFPVEVFPYTQEELHCPLAKVAINKGMVLFQRHPKPKIDS